MVECQLPKLKVASSSLVARSIFPSGKGCTANVAEVKTRLTPEPSLPRIYVPVGLVLFTTGRHRLGPHLFSSPPPAECIAGGGFC
jgi:hypothetical protein